MTAKTSDLLSTSKREAILIPAVTGEFCNACGEVVLDAVESQRVSAALLDEVRAA